MPRHEKPNLSHRRFEFVDEARRIKTDLFENRREVLSAAGFKNEFELGDGQDPFSTEYADDAKDVLSEIAGVLVKTAAIYVDAGNKADAKIAATVRKIAREPELLIDHGHAGVEPEAEGLVALNYQSDCGEPVGSRWYEVTEGGATAENIRRTANRALLQLETEKRLGRPKNVAREVLADGLREAYLRFRPKIDGASQWKETATPEKQYFRMFVELLLEPLESILVDYRDIVDQQKQGDQRQNPIFRIDEIVRDAASRRVRKSITRRPAGWIETNKLNPFEK